MGQSESSLSDETQLLHTFRIVTRVHHLNLLHLEHLDTHKPYLLREQSFSQEKDQIDALTKLKMRQSWSSPHLTNLIKYEHNKREDMCAKYYNVHGLWQYPHRTLAEEVNARALAKQPLPPGQITALILHIAEGALTLQKHRIPHECLTAKSILLQSNLLFRVVDPIATPLTPNIDILYHNRNVKNIYLSPEQCRLLDEQYIYKTVSDPFKSDVFTAGMIVLEAGLLERQDGCYQEDSARVCTGELEKRVQRFGEMYGGWLKGVVEKMVEIEVGKRYDWEEVIEEIRGKQEERKSARKTMNNGRMKTEEDMKKSFVFTYIQGLQSKDVRERQALALNRVTQVPTANPAKEIRSNISNLNNVAYGGNVSNNNGNISHTSNPINSYHNKPNNGNGNVIVSTQLRTQNNTTNASNSPVRPSASVAYVQSTTKGYSRPTTIFNYLSPTNSHPIEPSPFVRQPLQSTSKPLHSVQTSSLPTHTYLQPDLTPKSQHQIVQFDSQQPVYSVDQFMNGSKYEGFKRRGKRQGWGKYTYQYGGSYQGEWKNDMMNGRGKLYYQSGKIAYEGLIQNDLFHGIGTLYNEQPQKLQTPFDYQNFDQIEQYWITYEGQFRQDKKEGQGKLTLTNGQYLDGTFHEDKVEGQCLFVQQSGQIIRGIWHENKFQRPL